MPLSLTFRSQWIAAAAVFLGAFNLSTGAWAADNHAQDISSSRTGFRRSIDQRRSHQIVTLHSLSGSHIKIGDRIDFELTSAKRGFAHLYVLSASGRVQVWLENVPIDAGETLQYPDSDVSLTAMAPVGKERILAIVTDRKISGFGNNWMTQFPETVFGYDHATFRAAVEGVFLKIPHNQLAFASTIVNVGR